MAQLLTNWLKTHGIVHQQKVLHNPDRSILLTEALLNGEGELTHDGALAVSTTPYTCLLYTSRRASLHCGEFAPTWQHLYRPRSVSYTHLDVYKRQFLGFAIQAEHPSQCN